MVFDLQRVELEPEPDGTPASSCVLVPAGAEAARSSSQAGLKREDSDLLVTLQGSTVTNPQSLVDLAAAVGVHRQIAHRGAKRLAQQGYVETRKVGRRILVWVTDAGSKLVTELVTARHKRNGVTNGDPGGSSHRPGHPKGPARVTNDAKSRAKSKKSKSAAALPEVASA
jgi:DNA-binding MarR family transcriptional regulator